MPLIVISAQDIDTAGLKVDVGLPADWINRELSETEATSAGPGHLAVRLSRSSTDVVVRGEATASVTMPCARCTDASSRRKSRQCRWATERQVRHAMSNWQTACEGVAGSERSTRLSNA